MKVVPENWIKSPDENGDGFLQANLIADIECPLPIETHHVAASDVTVNKEQEFSFIIEAAGTVQVYEDLNAYNESGHKFAAESICPCGLFPPSGQKTENFQQTPTCIITGVVCKTYEDPTEFGFGADDTIFSMKSLGCEWDAVVHAGCMEGAERLAVGSVVTGTYWIQGWPEEK